MPSVLWSKRTPWLPTCQTSESTPTNLRSLKLNSSKESSRTSSVCIVCQLLASLPHTVEKQTYTSLTLKNQRWLVEFSNQLAVTIVLAKTLLTFEACMHLFSTRRKIKISTKHDITTILPWQSPLVLNGFQSTAAYQNRVLFIIHHSTYSLSVKVTLNT